MRISKANRIGITITSKKKKKKRNNKKRNRKKEEKRKKPKRKRDQTFIFLTFRHLNSVKQQTQRSGLIW